MAKLNLWKTVFLGCVLCSVGVTSSTAQSFTTLVSFNHANGGKPNEIMQGTDGNFYGTTNAGGANSCFSGYGCGTVFKMTPTGTLSTLYSFCPQANCADGVTPVAGLVEANGSFFGTTYFGGLFGQGTIFTITPTGAFSHLYSFCSSPGCLDGGFPAVRLLPASNGSVAGTTFYGITSTAGPNGHGTIFNFLTAPASTVFTLYSFCSQPNCTDGFGGSSPLIQATDGNFYGTSGAGGPNNNSTYCRNFGCGTVFMITPLGGGTFTTFYGFCAQPNCTDGASPGGLIQARDGNFYGTTGFGGANGHGTIFRITPTGVLTTLHSFCSQASCADGSGPFGLVEAADGNFYGITFSAGPSGNGTIFKVSPAGALTTLYSFCSQAGCPDGVTPSGRLIQGTDGNFYGTTFSGANSSCFGGCGTVFRLTVETPPTIASISPTSAIAGGPAFTLTVNGTNFVSGSAVNFNGNALATTFVSATQLTAVVPASGITLAGAFNVIVTNPGGQTSNALSFTVVTPQQATQAIMDSVNSLFSQGVINGGQDNSLVGQLQHAITMMNAGKNAGAIGNLGSFISEVNDLLSSGVLSPSQAGSLTSAAQSVIAAI